MQPRQYPQQNNPQGGQPQQGYPQQGYPQGGHPQQQNWNNPQQGNNYGNNYPPQQQ